MLGVIHLFASINEIKNPISLCLQIFFMKCLTLKCGSIQEVWKRFGEDPNFSWMKNLRL